MFSDWHDWWLSFKTRILIGSVERFAGFSSLALDEQMHLLQNTWLDVVCMNLAFRSVPYRGLLIFADDFKLSEENAARLGLPSEFDAVARRLARKFTDLCLTREEYLLLKAMLLLNAGKVLILLCCL